MANHTRYRALHPNSAIHPLLKQIFAEQESKRMSLVELAELTGISRTRLAKLRHPNGDAGKKPSLAEVQALAKALGFQFPIKLRKYGDL